MEVRNWYCDFQVASTNVIVENHQGLDNNVGVYFPFLFFSFFQRRAFYKDTSFCIIFLFNILFESLVMYPAFDSVFVINSRFIKKNWKFA